MIYLPLVLIPTLFLLVARIQPRLPAALRPAACAVCIAVASTWILLLATRPFQSLGLRVPMELIAILIGMSIVGVTFKLEPFYKRREIRHYAVVRLALMVGGLYTAFFALDSRLSEALVSALAALFIAVLATFFFQHEKGGSSHSSHLDNCC